LVTWCLAWNGERPCIPDKPATQPTDSQAGEGRNKRFAEALGVGWKPVAQPPTGHLEALAFDHDCDNEQGIVRVVLLSDAEQAISDAVGEERERLLGFREFVDKCESWLQNYPAEIFDGSSGDPGPLFAVAVRDAVAKIRSGDPDAQ
jgi:hypothetical protein